MSGELQFRVNSIWTNSTNPGHSVDWFFSEVMHFFEDHPNMDVISYGVGKTESGTSLPASWLDWADDYSESCPWGDNAWFVVEAQNASADLSGSGSRQWQAKFQACNSTSGFDDCNVADTSYGWEGTDYIMAVRFSPDGGWVGSGTLDFVGVTASDNESFIDGWNAYDGKMHLAGDDDTIVGYCKYSPGTPDSRYSKPFYMGETVRSISENSKPELMIAPRMGYVAESTAQPSVGRGSSGFAFWTATELILSFSIASNDDPVESHLANGLTDTSYGRLQNHDIADPWSGDHEIYPVLIRQYDGEHQSVIGQLRFWAMLDQDVGPGTLLPDGDWLSVGYDTTSVAGVGFPWPGSGTTPLFPTA